MRPKFVITLLIFAFAVFGAIYFLRPKPATTATPVPAVETNDVAATVNPLPGKKSTPVEAAMPVPAITQATVTNASPVVPAATNLVLTAEQRTVILENLFDWSMRDATDPEALTNIVLALSSSDQQVRHAAVEATRQFGSKAAIPALKERAEKADNVEEKKDLLDAVQFLTLPMLGSPEAKEEAAPEVPNNETPAAETTKP